MTERHLMSRSGPCGACGYANQTDIISVEQPMHPLDNADSNQVPVENLTAHAPYCVLVNEHACRFCCPTAMLALPVSGKDNYNRQCRPSGALVATPLMLVGIVSIVGLL